MDSMKDPGVPGAAEKAGVPGDASLDGVPGAKAGVRGAGPTEPRRGAGGEPLGNLARRVPVGATFAFAPGLAP